MNQAIAIALLIVAGAGVFGYWYHLRPRRFDQSGREQVTHWTYYGWVDLYLKVSTLAVTFTSLAIQDPRLLPFHNSAVLRWVGLGIAGLALALFVAAMKTLDAQYSPAHVALAPRQLVADGPYRYIRHPIYSANLLLMLGMLLVSGSLWLVLNLAILVVFYDLTMRREERVLGEQFPEYDAYARRTGRILPRLGTSARPPARG